MQQQHISFEKNVVKEKNFTHRQLNNTAATNISSLEESACRKIIKSTTSNEKEPILEKSQNGSINISHNSSTLSSSCTSASSSFNSSKSKVSPDESNGPTVLLLDNEKLPNTPGKSASGSPVEKACNRDYQSPSVNSFQSPDTVLLNSKRQSIFSNLATQENESKDSMARSFSNNSHLRTLNASLDHLSPPLANMDELLSESGESMNLDCHSSDTSYTHTHNSSQILNNHKREHVKETML
jgi:hypothetical protein